MQKKWQVRESAPAEVIAANGGNQLLAQLLYNRGLTNQAEIDFFFNPDYSKLHDPMLFRDMGKAVARIWQAIELGEKILIHGDYDADGITASSVLFRALKILDAVVEVFIPHREEDGYGINVKNVIPFTAKGIKLLITVDCGTSNVSEVDALIAAGMDVIVTDHHQAPAELPKPLALLNPKVADSGYPFDGLVGAGVAFKLAQALYAETDKMQSRENKFSDFGGSGGYLKWLLDLVAIGTVADVAPLIGENRILVKWGLVVLGKTRNAGLKALLELVSSKKLDTQTIGFQIAPRLNAAGRLEHAKHAFHLLIEDDPTEAERMAWILQEFNVKRQKVTEAAMVEARAQFDATACEAKILFAYGADWDAGIVGLIAGRLSEQYYRPVLAMTGQNDQVVGSGRSIEGFNITDALVSACDFLAKYGGHSQACGFTLKSLSVLEQFKETLLAHAAEKIGDELLLPSLAIEARLKFSGLDMATARDLNRFEPYGEANPKPLFLLEGLLIAAMDRIGAGEKHLRLMVRQDTPQLYKAIWFYPQPDQCAGLAVGDIIELVAEIGINEWNGREEIEIRVVELRKSM